MTHIKQAELKTLKRYFELVKEASQNPDPDLACSPLMDWLGITTGDVAAMCFSDCGEDSIMNIENWGGLTPAQRETAIHIWVHTETNHIEGGE